MFSYTHLICEEADVAAFLIPVSPDAEKAVAAQPLEDLAYQSLSDQNMLEVLPAPDPYLAAPDGFASTLQPAAPLILKP